MFATPIHTGACGETVYPHLSWVEPSVHEYPIISEMLSARDEVPLEDSDRLLSMERS